MTIKMKILKPALLALGCALILAFSNNRAEETIESNQQRYEQRILRSMVNGADLVESPIGHDVYREGFQVGTIERVNTPRGYNGNIELLVALSLAREVISVRVVAHNETPGIGDKIESGVSNWIDQFTGKSYNNSDWSLAPIGDIDAITGATVTSRAVSNAISEVVTP